jgi:hypothetical protein
MYDIECYNWKTNEQITKEFELEELQGECKELVKSDKKLAIVLIKQMYKKTCIN